jgi:hypothetical protein
VACLGGAGPLFGSVRLMLVFLQKYRRPDFRLAA